MNKIQWIWILVVGQSLMIACMATHFTQRLDVIQRQNECYYKLQAGFIREIQRNLGMKEGGHGI